MKPGNYFILRRYPIKPKRDICIYINYYIYLLSTKNPPPSFFFAGQSSIAFALAFLCILQFEGILVTNLLLACNVVKPSMFLMT